MPMIHRAGAPVLAAALAAFAAELACADEGRMRVAPTPRYAQECASCHVAYPPGLLPAASWQRLMGGLSHHFGTDASLEPAAVNELSTWLVANAATGKRAAVLPPDDRITRSAWFVREHRKVAASVWSRPSVKGPSNCSACHTQADRGDFDEHTIRIPR